MGVLLRLAGWVVANWRAISFGSGVAGVVELMRSGGITKIISDWIVEAAAQDAGLRLDPENPLSDASFSAAIGEKIGFRIRTLLDKESIKEDVLDGAALLLTERTGIQIRSLYQIDIVVEDLENWALQMIEQKTNIRLSSLRDVEALRGDFVKIAGGVITAQTGIPLTDITNPDQIKLDVMDWARDAAMLEIGESVNTAVSAEWKQGVSMLKMLRDRMGKNVSPRALLRGVNDAMVARYAVRLQDVGTKTVSKKDVRRYQNKLAQRRFRARADRNNPMWDGRVGGKTGYVPKGWTVTYNKPSAPVKRRLGGGKTIGLKR